MPGLEKNPTPPPGTYRASERLACLEVIQAELQQVRRRIADLLAAPDDQIRTCLAYLTASPGKMIRPGLVLLSGACLGRLTDAHIDLAAMVELVHRASLLHDDVIDAAQMRRGNQTANALWGNTAAVLLGDYLLSRAFYLGTSIHLDGTASILCQTAQQLCSGELRQNFRKGQWDLSVEQYYQLIEDKTAALFQSSCRLGAMAADASSEQMEAFGRYGRHLGMAFQMTDDLLDILGTVETAGKTVGTDLQQGKLTLPVIHWIQQDPKTKHKRITQLDQGCDPRTLIREMTQSGSIDYALAQVRDEISQAKKMLGTVPPNPAKQSLETLADYVADRLKESQ